MKASPVAWTSFMEAWAVFFSSLIFDHQNPGPDSPEMLDPDSVNPNPQLFFKIKRLSTLGTATGKLAWREVVFFFRLNTYK
jgi:hypothetical protein